MPWWTSLIALGGVGFTAGVTWFVARWGRSDRGFERAEDRVQAAIDKAANPETQWIGVNQILALLANQQIPASMYPVTRATLEAVYAMKSREIDEAPGRPIIAIIEDSLALEAAVDQRQSHAPLVEKLDNDDSDDRTELTP